ncbi:hypothetical protein [Frigidibacter sp. ROC022]|uniref:hypothetical protein n=1 Tax=Frigidibacter sp. ROC022 TaxID=2971796 RepID=UPI003082D7D6
MPGKVIARHQSVPGPVVGLARALREQETAGALAGIGMGRNAPATATLAPLAIHWQM